MNTTQPEPFPNLRSRGGNLLRNLTIGLALVVSGLLMTLPLRSTASAAPQSALVARPMTEAATLPAARLWRLSVDVATDGTGPTLLSLPGALATVPGGVILRSDVAIAITDARIVGDEGELVELLRYQQVGSVSDRLWSFEAGFTVPPVRTDYHSAFGLLVRGDSPTGAGLAVSSTTAQSVRVELSGYTLPNN